jgi:hypothetical protein
MKVVLAALAFLALSLSTTAVEARQRSVAAHPDCNILWPCEGVYPHPRGVRIARKMPFGEPVLRYRTAQPRVVSQPRVAKPRRQVASAPAAPKKVAALPALPRVAPSKSLDGVVPILAEKVREIVATCGSQIWSTVRHTFVAGTRRISQHASGTAVDLHGNPGCIYAMLRGWPGGYSTDYARVRHVHVSYGGREHGARFAHGGGTRYARRHAHRYRYASAAR